MPVEVVVDWASQHCSCAESPGCTDPNDPDYSDTPARAFVDGAGVAHAHVLAAAVVVELAPHLWSSPRARAQARA